MNKNKLLRWMIKELTLYDECYIFPGDIEPSATLLAEEAITYYGITDAWHDDTHYVWDIAVDAIDKYQQSQKSE